MEEFDAVAAGCTPAPGGSGHAISFSPTAAAVPVGTTVTWTNHNDIPHRFISSEKAFASLGPDTDQQFSFRFDTAGAYPYYGSIHPKMAGKVIVG